MRPFSYYRRLPTRPTGRRPMIWTKTQTTQTQASYKSGTARSNVPTGPGIRRGGRDLANAGLFVDLGSSRNGKLITCLMQQRGKALRQARIAPRGGELGRVEACAAPCGSHRVGPALGDPAQAVARPSGRSDSGDSRLRPRVSTRRARSGARCRTGCCRAAPAIVSTARCGGTRGDQVAIEDGVKTGEVVVTAGQIKLRNGSSVIVNNDVLPSNDPSPNPPNE